MNFGKAMLQSINKWNVIIRSCDIIKRGKFSILFWGVGRCVAPLIYDHIIAGNWRAKYIFCDELRLGKWLSVENCAFNIDYKTSTYVPTDLYVAHTLIWN